MGIHKKEHTNEFNWLKYFLNFFTITCPILLNHLKTQSQQCPWFAPWHNHPFHEEHGFDEATFPPSCSPTVFGIFVHVTDNHTSNYIQCRLLLTRRCQIMTMTSWLLASQEKVQGWSLASIVRDITTSAMLTTWKNVGHRSGEIRYAHGYMDIISFWYMDIIPWDETGIGCKFLKCK